MTEEQWKDLVTEYVYKRYKSYRDKDLIIEVKENHFTIRTHVDESPLILSKHFKYAAVQ